MSHSQEGVDEGLNLVPLAPEPPTFQSSTPRQKDWKQGALGCGASSPPGPLSEPRLLLQCVGSTEPTWQGQGAAQVSPGRGL